MSTTTTAVLVGSTVRESGLAWIVAVAAPILES
jgi:hypothetical protein